MNKIIPIAVVLLLLGAFAHNLSTRSNQPGPKKNQGQNTNIQTGKTDFSYGNDPRNTLHIVVPKDINSSTSFILFIHGGAWTSGDKKDMLGIQQVFAGQGIASGAINYRYASASVHYDDLMNDVHSAVVYIEDHMGEWGLTKKKIAIGGISAGAHMSLLYTYVYDSEKNISSVISLAGPTDLTQTDMLDTAVKNRMITFVEWLTNGTYKNQIATGSGFAAASPIKHIRNIPTLLIQGNKDSIVLYNQSVALDTALTQAGVAHKFVTIPNANHDLGLAVPANAIRIGNEVTSWIKKYSK